MESLTATTSTESDHVINKSICRKCKEGTIRLKNAIGSKFIIGECDKCGAMFVTVVK